MDDKEKEKDEETTSWNNGELEEKEEEEAWGTLEELLLVCAVNRHGMNRWDSISNELQKRIKHSSNVDGDGTVSSFSSGKCRKRYVDLKRRFHNEVVAEAEEGGEEHLVDELRKLRVEELKREVHQHDVSIVSLQLKVRRLEEERETKEGADLRIKPEEEKTTEIPQRSSLEKVVTDDSAENRSCNESNSTNHNKFKDEPEGPAAVQMENTRTEPLPDRKMSRLGELGESLSESRRESTRQQSSDVQSSASLAKKKRRRFRGDSGDELEAEEVSPANNAKSQPLIRFFETLRSHKHGSVFQRRLPSQETEKYRNMIRQHMDLDMVQSRLDKGIYCDCHPRFYRDLLLVFTNAVLFYRKSSAEHIAARELRKFVSDEITQKTRKPKIQPRKPDLEPKHLEPVVKKPRSSTTMVVCRRRNSSSMQALSDSMKKGDTNNTTSATNSKNNGRDEKAKPDHHQKTVGGSINNNNNNNNNNGSPSNKSVKGGDKGSGGAVADDRNLKKLLTRERSHLGNGARLSSNNGKKIISKEGNVKKERTGNAGKDRKQETSEGEVVERRKTNGQDQKHEKGTPIVLKKQGVANFLKRMKQNSPSSQEKTKHNDSEEEEDKEEEGGRRDTTQGTNNNGKKIGGNLKKMVKEVEVGTTRRSSGRRGEKEEAASRRGIGRPPKRKAAMMSGNTPDSAKAGRSGGGGRDSGDKVKKKPRR